jgi:hypothetical protein
MPKELLMTNCAKPAYQSFCNRLMLMSLLGLSISGCEFLGKIAPPGAAFRGVDLVEHPSAREMARWGCFEYLTEAVCGDWGLGLNTVKDSKMGFSFDISFDLSNNNEKLPIPLVEILLATSVYDDIDFGAVCISFCDPEEDDCEPTSNAKDGCDSTEAEEVTSASELVPTIEELQDIARNVAFGDVDNGDFRTIPANSDVEAHIQFDLNIHTMLKLSKDILWDLGEDILSGRDLSVTIPYVMNGSLFFSIPEMGPHAIGFGPIEDKWKF